MEEEPIDLGPMFNAGFNEGKRRKTIKLEDAYFGYVMPEMSYRSKNERKLATYNLFEGSRVRYSVARWVTMDEKERKRHNFLSFCFFDVCGRVEYEWIISPWPYDEGALVKDEGKKIDVYEAYVKPNEKLLRQIVDSISVSSATRYLREERKRRR